MGIKYKWRIFMASYKKLFDAYDALTPIQTEGLGKKYAVEITKYFQSISTSEEDIYKFFVDLFKLAISADLNLSNAEPKFYNPIIGDDIGYDAFFEKTNYGGSENFINEMKGKIQKYPVEVKNYMYSLILIILVSDGPVNDKEKAFFKKFY